MQIGDQVKINGCDTVFIIDLIVNGEALLKKEVGNIVKIADWIHCSELIRAV